MSRFIESLCFTGSYDLLDLHQKRVNRTFSDHFPDKQPFLLTDILPVPVLKEKLKVRVIYDGSDFTVEHSPYQVIPIHSLKLIRADTIEYSYKYENRDFLTRLFASREGADDIIIIREGQVTDSYYANVAFWDGQGWITPTTYLLNGVKRQWLIQSGQLKESEIKVEDINTFKKICLINALLDLGEVEVPVDKVE